MISQRRDPKGVRRLLAPCLVVVALAGIPLVNVLLLKDVSASTLHSKVARRNNAAPSGFGQPLEGMTAEQFELFELGREDFMEVEGPDDGLGPIFNARSCAECHNIPAVGGSGTITELRAGRRREDGSFEDLPGGSLFQLFSIPPHICQETVPVEANVVAGRKSIPLFGAGLIEAIPDQALEALEDPNDRDGDGISGRVHWVVDVASGSVRAGRFGWKAQHATLLAFAADAYREEMGITSDLFGEEAAPNGNIAALRDCDFVPDPEDAPDPETGLRGIDNFENFLRFLAPPPARPLDPASDPGGRVFQELRCGSCHVPRLATGPNPVVVLDQKPVFLYSDLLLHDVGTGDGIVQGSALAGEIRTPALWGLGVRQPLLHDGSAADIRSAIVRHAGEAVRSKEAFLRLNRAEQSALLRFLSSL